MRHPAMTPGGSLVQDFAIAARFILIYGKELLRIWRHGTRLQSIPLAAGGAKNPRSSELIG
jgi:hypothetical protein